MEYGFPLFKAHRAITGFFFMRLIQGSVKGKGRWKMDSLCSKHGTITVFFFSCGLYKGVSKGKEGDGLYSQSPLNISLIFFSPSAGARECQTEAEEEDQIMCSSVGHQSVNESRSFFFSRPAQESINLWPHLKKKLIYDILIRVSVFISFSIGFNNYLFIL